MEINKVVMVAPWWLRAVGAWQNLGQDIVDASAGFFGCLIYFVVVCRHTLFITSDGSEHLPTAVRSFNSGL